MALIRLAEVAGQERAKRLLRLAQSRGRTAHALLFHGPAGVGKKMTARAFAAFLLCQAQEGGDSCGRCPSCRKLASDNHPDLVVVRPEGAQIKIDQVCELKRTLAYASSEGGFRVVLLADIHQTMPRAEVANSLLKTLEEPPADTVFILTAVEAAGILPTIVSRCQGIPFYPLSDELVRDRLLAGGLALDNLDKAGEIAAISGGSLVRAREFAEGGLLASWGELLSELLALSPGRPGAVERVLALAERIAGLKEELEAVFNLLQAWLMAALLAGAAGREGGEEVRAAQRRWPPARLLAKLELLRLSQRQLRCNCNRSFVCEVLLWGLVTD